MEHHHARYRYDEDSEEHHHPLDEVRPANGEKATEEGVENYNAGGDQQGCYII